VADKKKVVVVPAEDQTCRVTRFYVDSQEMRLEIGVKNFTTGEFTTHSFEDDELLTPFTAILQAHPELRKLREIATSILFEQGVEQEEDWTDE
jgi:hypothetical protein